MKLSELEASLSGRFKGMILPNESMSKHISFRIGGNADLLVLPTSVDDLLLVLGICKSQNIPWTIIGNGSNVLVLDGGIRGVVIKMGKEFSHIDIHGTRIIAEAGATLAAVATQAAKQELTGMEFAAGIPGTIGGAIFMNAGAYDGEMKMVVTGADILTLDGQLEHWDINQLALGYRTSSVQTTGAIVLKVYLQLTVGDKETIVSKLQDFAQRRCSKQPLELPSAGSTFKRPTGNYAGTLIEQAGLKGYTVGGAQVSTKHAGFVVNIGEATAQDVLRLIQDVQKRVEDYSGILLEPEVRIVGEEGEYQHEN